MKKLFLMLAVGFALSFTAQAQTADAPAMTKEQKAQAKAAKDAQFNQSLVEAQLTPKEIDQVKTITTEMNEKGKELRASSLTEEEKAAKKKELDAEKKAKYIEVMGADRYKAWGNIKKKLAEQAPTN